MILKRQQALGASAKQGRIPNHSTKPSTSSKLVPIEQGMIPIAEEISISYIIVQHKKEMLDTNLNFKTVLNETLDDEFMTMLQSCLFVPFLHENTP